MKIGKHGHGTTAAGPPSASPGRVNPAWLGVHAGVSRPGLACSAAGVRPVCMKAGGGLGYVSRKDRTTVRAGCGVLSAGLTEAVTVTQTARSLTRTPEPADEGGLEKSTGQAKDGTRARKGKGIRVSQARVTKAKGGEAGSRRLRGGHATQGEKGLTGCIHQGPIRGNTGNQTSPEFD
jgi:hypothetical protein